MHSIAKSLQGVSVRPLEPEKKPDFTKTFRSAVTIAPPPWPRTTGRTGMFADIRRAVTRSTAFLWTSQPAQSRQTRYAQIDLQRALLTIKNQITRGCSPQNLGKEIRQAAAALEKLGKVTGVKIDSSSAETLYREAMTNAGIIMEHFQPWSMDSKEARPVFQTLLDLVPRSATMKAEISHDMGDRKKLALDGDLDTVMQAIVNFKSGKSRLGPDLKSCIARLTFADPAVLQEKIRARIDVFSQGKSAMDIMQLIGVVSRLKRHELKEGQNMLLDNIIDQLHACRDEKSNASYLPAQDATELEEEDDPVAKMWNQVARERELAEMAWQAELMKLNAPGH
jgi:hypothetical protein